MIHKVCNSTVSLLIILLCSFHLQSSAKRSELIADNLYLVQNVGQIKDQYGHNRPDINFKVNSGNVQIFIGSNGIHYQWKKPINEDNTPLFQTYRLDVTLVGAHKHITPEILEQGTFYETYYTNDLDGAVAKSGKKVIYRNIYDNIDWVIYTKDGTLKYDFVVHEGGVVNDIKFEYKGASNIEIVKQALQITTPFGIISEHAPYTYTNDSKQFIPSAYTLEGNTVTFNTNNIISNLTVDPTLEWASYYGDDSVESAYSLTTDSSLNVYIAGRSKSIANIATSGAFQTTIGGNDDAYIASFNSGGFIRWATYYGGNGNEVFYSITTDSKDKLLLAGVTDTSYNLSYAAKHQSNHGGGGSDCFVLKMNTSGSRIWCTYYGGEDEEQENLEYQAFVTTDANDNIYLAGTTKSDTGIATTGTAQTTRGGNYDAFLVKFDDDGDRLWGTYYGGSNIDNFRKIALDNDGNVYVAGIFQSSGMATSGTYQVNSNGKLECLLARYNNSNGTLKWATYFGGSNDDTPQGLGVDDNFSIYLSGSTNSSSNIATSGAHQTQLNAGSSTGVYDAFIAKFDTSAIRVWSTYYGGSAVDHSGELVIDNAGNIMLTGSTASTTNIATQGAHQASSGGNNSFDAFFAVFTPTGTRTWASYYGDINQDYGFGIDIVETGHTYICGNTASSSNIAYSGHQVLYGGNNDAFLAKFTPDTTAFIFQPFTQTVHCAGDSFVLNYGTTSPFRAGNTFTVQLSDNSGSFASPTNIGNTTATTNGTITCNIPTNQTGTGFRIRIIATNPADTSYDNGNNITIKPNPVSPTATSNSPVCSNDTLDLNATTSTSSVSYLWSGPNNWFSNVQNAKRGSLDTSLSGNYIVTVNLNGCTKKDTINVTVIQAPQTPIAQNNGPLCTGDTLVLDGDNISNGAVVGWTGPNGYTSTQTDPNPIPNVSTSLDGVFTITSTFSNGCSGSDTTVVSISQSPSAINASSNSPVCSGDSLKLYASNSTSGVSYQWSGPGSFTSTIEDPVKGNIQTADSGEYIVTASVNNCVKKDTVNVTVIQSPTKPDAGSNSPLCSGMNLQLTGSNISSAATVSWTGPNNFSSSLDSPVRTNIQTSDSGQYIITTNISTCSTSDTVQVSVTQSVVANIDIKVTPGTTVCPTANLNFTISPGQPVGTTYNWTGPNNWSSNASSATNNNISYVDSGYYKVKTITGLCTAGEDSVYIKVVDTISKPEIVSNSPVCVGDSLIIELRHPDTVSLTLFDPVGDSSTGLKVTYLNVPISYDGIYYLRAFSGGCTTYDTANITVKPKPAKPTVSNNSPVCESDDLTLTSMSSTAGVNYEWEGPGGYTANTGTVTINNIDLSRIGYYYSHVTLNGCGSEKDSTLVTVNANPTPEVETNSPVCEGNEMRLYVTNAGNETYNWSRFSGSFTANGDTVRIATARLTDDDRYIVTATDNTTGCMGYDTVLFDITPLPGDIQLVTNSPICEREALVLSVEDTSTDVLYTWFGPRNFYDTNKNATRSGLTTNHAGYYRLQVSRNGCIITDSTEVVIKQAPEIPLLSSNSPVSIGGEILLFMTNPTAGANFRWTGPNNYSSLIKDPVIVNAAPEDAGTYILTTKLGDCTAADSIDIVVGNASGQAGVFVLFPNPNDGNFTLKADLLTDNRPMPFEIINSIGMVVFRDNAIPEDFLLDYDVSVENKLAAGVYFLRIIYQRDVLEVPFTIVR